MTLKNPYSVITIKPKVKYEVKTDLNKLEEETILNLQNSKSKNTVRAYKSDFNDFKLFCSKNSFRSLPSEPKIVSLYLTFLSTKEVKMSTLKRRLVSIGVINKLKGHYLDTKHPSIIENIMGIKRRKGSIQKGKKPLLISNLKELINVIDKQNKAEIKKMEQDREDLVSAIIKLKQSINELNQKGRERLLEAFEKVNRKFNEVYTKLFNGGNAKLELVDSDDPLEAGLEMLVSPPGKRLQSITLLSGGEQALTALSLIFAVFLTNPSPICVLDEVDAPLDDANVTRFCGLLDDLTKITNTKFIIVTHHALTMSKMNRLYGVTMPEKGISQLVAVDLQKAESMVA